MPIQLVFIFLQKYWKIWNLEGFRYGDLAFISELPDLINCGPLVAFMQISFEYPFLLLSMQIQLKLFGLMNRFLEFVQKKLEKSRLNFQSFYFCFDWLPNTTGTHRCIWKIALEKYLLEANIVWECPSTETDIKETENSKEQKSILTMHVIIAILLKSSQRYGWGNLTSSPKCC